MITYYFRTLKDDELKTLAEPRSGVWTHVVGASDEEIEYLTKEFALDEAILRDAQDFFEVPRLEKSGGVTYFFARYPYEQHEEDVDTAPLLIVMGESFVITIALKDVPQFQQFIDGTVAIHTTQKAKFFIQLIGAITRSYERKLVHLRRAVHRDRVQLRQIGSRQIVRFVDYEHELNDMMSAVVPMNAWLQQITTGNYMQLYNEDIELMEDLMIANSQLLDSARSVLKTLQNVRTASEAILTNNLNATIRTLTILTILLTIPTIIASLYGMNITLPLMEHPHAFWLVVLAILTIVSLVIWTFRRLRWL